jgi:hypothetical protein
MRIGNGRLPEFIGIEVTGGEQGLALACIVA